MHLSTSLTFQKLLKTWCRMKYLDKDSNNYALGVRAIHEFEGYLRQNMPDAIEECCLCKQIVFRVGSFVLIIASEIYFSSS